jgi:[ribosomal protein S5]-alanine N-acetyltransferase
MKLECQNCCLRPFVDTDAPALARHANNRAIWLNLTDDFPYPYTMDEAERWIKFTAEATHLTNFAIDVAGEVVGGIGLKPYQGIKRYTAEIGYWLGEAFWGRGLASEAVGAVSHYAFAQLGFRRLQALVYAYNPTSMRILAKNGYVHEGILRNGACKDGRMVDEYLYARVHPETK